MQHKKVMMSCAGRSSARFANAASAAACAASVLALAGCGAWQATRDTTVGAAQWLFTTQVKTMNVDLDARAATNETTGGQSLSTVVRLYQLKDSQTFAKLEYVQLQNNDLELLKADLLATRDVIVKPGAAASVSEPMDKDAEYVGVVAFFRSPNSNGVWKVLIPKKQWKDTDPVKVHVANNTLAYEGANPKPVKRDAPQQSTPVAKASPGMAASDVSSGTGSSASNNAMNEVKNHAAALGNAADTGGYSSAPAKAAVQNVNAATTSVTNVKTSASAAIRSATGLLLK
ncbi:type VI secretion system lipoprotein TssJ [Caballeronia sp. LZ025]|uniref:type VI secretion system lipoprotein TssJ n=1 Tax=Caballeronia TaxID=1827195 RepID=UPI001FD39BA2|nr:MULTISPECIES: type VI secretion system lipoprotein TssJ [Caballeronia]MDR5735830.1 type VI secretion system lipoprotein TssJ [Caballeronia sp. LZ025]